MKKTTAVALIVIIALCLIAIILLAGCNMTVVDTTWSFERAIIFLPDSSTIEGEVESWTEYEGSDMIQVKIDDTVYLTHSANVILISE